MTTSIENLALPTILDQIKRMGLSQEVFRQECAFAILAMEENDKLSEVLSTIPEVIVKAMAIGLTLNPAMKEAALVTRWSKSRKQTVAGFEPMYPALIKLASRSANFVDVTANVVYENDHFEASLGEIHTPIVHRPAMKDRGEIIAAYALMTYPNGMRKAEFVDMDDLVKIEKLKAGGDRNSTYTNWKDQMYRKIALRRLLKYIPKENTPATRALVAAIDADEKLFDFDRLPESKVPAAPTGIEGKIAACQTIEELGDLYSSDIIYTKHTKLFTVRKQEILQEQDIRINAQIAAFSDLYELESYLKAFDEKTASRYENTIQEQFKKLGNG